MNMKVRPATVADIDDVIRVCDQAWKGIWQGDRQMFIDRITIFPECGIVVGEIDGCIEGYVSVQLANDDIVYCPTWNEATDFGHLTKSHNPHGEWLHGVGLAVSPKGCRGGMTECLISYLFGYAVAEKKRGCRFVTRMPGYFRHNIDMSPDEYACARHNGKPLDPELRILGNYGFKVLDPPVIFQNYVDGGGDPGSCGYSVLIEQLNPTWKDNVLLASQGLTV